MMTLEETIEEYEKVAYFDWFTDEQMEVAQRCKQIAEWLRELQERRKEPEIVRCGECVNFSERDFCKVAGHNVHRKSNCMKVFGAERRTE